jgi:membrane-associated PAP2 superfamily phosphatase
MASTSLRQSHFLSANLWLFLFIILTFFISKFYLPDLRYCDFKGEIFHWC